MGWARRAVAQVATEVSRIDAGPIPVGMAAAFAHHQQQWAAIARAARHTCLPWMSWPIGVCRGRECGSHQPTHVITSSAHAVHVLHAPGAQQQPACSSDVASEQQRTRTEAIEADATIFVDIGAHSGAIDSPCTPAAPRRTWCTRCTRLVRSNSPLAAPMSA